MYGVTSWETQNSICFITSEMLFKHQNIFLFLLHRGKCLNGSYHYHARVEQGEVQVVDVRVTWVIFSHLCIGQPGLGGAL